MIVFVHSTGHCVYVHMYVCVSRYSITIIHFKLFIHYGNLYSASSRLLGLVRSASDPCTAKEKSVEAGVELHTNDYMPTSAFKPSKTYAEQITVGGIRP